MGSKSFASKSVASKPRGSRRGGKPRRNAPFASRTPAADTPTRAGTGEGAGEGAGERGEAGDEKDKNECGAAEETEAPGVGSASVPFSETETRSRTAEKGKAPAAVVPAFPSEASPSEASGEGSE